MRKIEWEPKTYTSVKERASAIAWATNRRGSRVWVGKNVTQQITDYLHEHGYKVDRSRVLMVMKRLAADRYAYIRMGDGDRSVAEWGFMPDVELSGHGLPEKEGLPEAADPGKASILTLPPIPAAPDAPLYRMDELEKHLQNWAEKDHETYAGWIDAAIESLRHNT